MKKIVHIPDVKSIYSFAFEFFLIEERYFAKFYAIENEKSLLYVRKYLRAKAHANPYVVIYFRAGYDYPYVVGRVSTLLHYSNIEVRIGREWLINHFKKIMKEHKT